MRRVDRATATPRCTGIAVLAFLAFAGLATVLYATSTHLYAGGSDMATTILQGQAMSRGNLLLHGWILTRDPYWTTDSLVFALGCSPMGFGPAFSIQDRWPWSRSPSWWAPSSPRRDTAGVPPRLEPLLW